MGSYLEEQYNRDFNDGKISLENFDTKKAYETGTSPFKQAIAEEFKQYNTNSELIDEINSFKNMLLKTQIILTTNYDTFIEDNYNSTSQYKITKYVGQKGFFCNTYGYAELFKIHGSVDLPNTIVITEEDYNNFDKNSILISSKIISTLINSPIVFIGYSLTDKNIRKIINNFTSQLDSTERKYLEDRIILIEYKKGESTLIEETINDNDLGCELKVIKTENFKYVFDTIAKINQGIAPTEIRKYQHIIKKLIIDKGKEGTLQTVLIAPEELNSLEKELQTKNIAVALGDAKYIFQMPDLITYCIDYLSDFDEINTNIRLKFIASQGANARLPINKILNEQNINESNLHPTEKKKLKQKMVKHSSFNKQYSSIVSSSVKLKNECSIEKITALDEKIENIYETISYNIEKIDRKQLKDFILSELSQLKDKGEIKLSTQFRRLILLYDILEYKTK